uniref:Uncharacterized protein n=3 Tax=Parascaris univalens TaxID=6257 RepID=A0A915CD59_PARUN
MLNTIDEIYISTMEQLFKLIYYIILALLSVIAPSIVVSLIQCTKKKRTNKAERSIKDDAAIKNSRDLKGKHQMGKAVQQKTNQGDKKKDKGGMKNGGNKKRGHKEKKADDKVGDDKGRQKEGEKKKTNGEKDKSVDERRREEEKLEEIRRDHQRDEPPEYEYPEVKEPTESAKKRREVELEKDKREKIEQGFYQEHSDEDDTLEPIKSLKEERTEDSQTMQERSPKSKHKKEE